MKIGTIIDAIRTGGLSLRREEQRCVRCSGTGRVQVFPRVGFGLNPGNRPTGTQTCPLCGGSGWTAAQNQTRPEEK